MTSNKGIVVHTQVVDQGSGVDKPKNWGYLTIEIPPTLTNNLGEDVSPELVSEIHAVVQRYDTQAAQEIYNAMPQRKAEWKPRPQTSNE